MRELGNCLYGIKVHYGEEWVITLNVTDPKTQEEATPANTALLFRLKETVTDPLPYWCGTWNFGIAPDTEIPGKVYITVPKVITDSFRRGTYSFELNVMSKTDPDISTKIVGHVTVVPAVPGPGETVFCETDPVATRLVEFETRRALKAEQLIRDSGLVYTLPIASSNELGGVKVGENLTIDADGTLNAVASSYTLPTASADEKGGIKIGEGLYVDNEKLKIADHGVTQDKLSPDVIADIDDVAAAVATLFDIGTVTLGGTTSVTITHTPDSPKYFFNFVIQAPEIGENGNWYISGSDTGVRARGVDGEDGEDGADGRGITGVSGPSEPTEAEEEDHPDDVKFTVTYTEGDDDVIWMRNWQPIGTVTEDSQRAVTSGAVWSALNP